MSVSRNFLTKRYYRYNVPARYSDAFYLANAALFDQVSWFLHRAYELSFSKLTSWLNDREPELKSDKVVEKVLAVVDVLDQCNSIIDVRFPVVRDSGKKEVIRGFRAHHGLYSGFSPCLGGLRIKKDVTRDQMKGLAALATYKHACMGIRFSGGCGAIKINPKEYTVSELERIVKSYVVEVYAKGYCNGVNDVFEPDVNVSGREMAWIASLYPDSFEKVMVVGKPPTIGGIENYPQMASQAVFFALDHFVNQESVLHQLDMTKPGLKQKTFIIQGLGCLGSALAQFLQKNGAICVGIKEHDSYLYDPNGIDIQAAVKHKEVNGTLQNFSKTKAMVNDTIFKEECDILILAAEAKTLICYVADKVKAKIIVEAANGAITSLAHRILVSRSKLVLPDIYVSSGYSIASYLEYLLAFKRTGEELPVIRRLYKHILEASDASAVKGQLVASSVTQKIVSCEMQPNALTYAIDHVMKETGNDLLDVAKEFNVRLDLRMAGYIKAIQSIHRSIYELNKY